MPETEHYQNPKRIRVIDHLEYRVFITFLLSLRENFPHQIALVITGSRSTHDVSRDRDYASNRLYLDLDRDGRSLGEFEDASPPSDNDLFDNQCYATTPSSSNGNSDLDQPSNTVGGDVVYIIKVDRSCDWIYCDSNRG